MSSNFTFLHYIIVREIVAIVKYFFYLGLLIYLSVLGFPELKKMYFTECLPGCCSGENYLINLYHIFVNKHINKAIVDVCEVFL